MANISVTLDRDDFGQILDGLTIRMEAYEATATYLEEDHNSDNIVIEEVKDADEARRMAGTYKRIVDAITQQIDS